ncbi:MAG: hypothetical protein EOP48_17350 [Sphingobacteriales bacterium]|nr:MAG: hypothetical protein EOP48_17350 [Sphingobacteriales bacterium]
MKHQSFNCRITYDIDIAWSYKYKGLVRTVAGFAKDLINRQWKALDDRWLVLRGEKKDPYDCFEWLDALHLYCRLKPLYFFLVAKKQIGYDKNISTDVKQFRELVEYYAGRYDAGIHPSWQSGDNKKLLKEVLPMNIRWDMAPLTVSGLLFVPLINGSMLQETKQVILPYILIASWMRIHFLNSTRRRGRLTRSY